MKIIHKYISSILIKNTLLVLGLFTALFLVIDFFDRIDNMVHAQASIFSALQYFVFKIPLIINLMLPLSFLVATLFSLGMLSKTSELTAMRASGLSTFYLAKPIYIIGLALSLVSLFLNETIVPTATRRVKEIYNLDIQKKDQSGTYSREDFWWRKGNRFININMFDSRSNKMLDLSVFDLNNEFKVEKRFQSKESEWISDHYGWMMRNVTEQQFQNSEVILSDKKNTFPLNISQEPEEFYGAKTETDAMSYKSLSKFIKKQAQNGIKVSGLYSDLYQKLSFPFITFIASFVALTFAIRPARGGGLGLSFAAGVAIGFSYYIVHSYAMALGRAEILPALLAAWTANIVMITVGAILHLGVDSPQ
jgi:lipopolysaccharide export system permease protein